MPKSDRVPQLQSALATSDYAQQLKLKASGKSQILNKGIEMCVTEPPKTAGGGEEVTHEMQRNRAVRYLLERSKNSARKPWDTAGGFVRFDE